MRRTEKIITTHERNKRFVVCAPILYFLILLLVAYHSYNKPDYNWDMLPYMALALKVEHKEVNTAHRLTYETAKENLPSSVYQNLTTANAYRKKMSEDAISFNEQLPFYVSKPLYILVVYGFYKIGFSLIAATTLPSILSFLFCGLLIFYWLKKLLGMFFAACLSLFAMLSPPILSFATLSTPDGLSALFLFASFYFMLEHPSEILAFLFMTFSVFTRLDNIIACFVLLSLFTFSNKVVQNISLKKFMLALFLLSIFYFMITSIATKYGWSIFYYDSFALHTSQLHGLDNNIGNQSKLKLLFSVILHGLYYSNIIILLAILFVLFIKPKPESFSAINMEQLFSLAICAIIFIRFILFQDIADRFYIAFYLVSVPLLIRNLKNYPAFLKHNVES